MPESQTGQGGAGTAVNPSSSGSIIGKVVSPLPGSAPGGAAGNGQTGVEGQGQPGQDGQSGTSTPPAPTRLFAGRYKTPEELEHAYDESSREGRRLFEASRALEAEKARLAAEAESLREQLKRGDSFKELNAEEVKKLREESPGAYADYIVAQREWQREAEARKEAGEVKQRQAQETQERIRETQRRQLIEMRSKPQEYPNFRELEPVMDELMDMAPYTTGRENSVEVLYLMAMGLMHLNGINKGSAAEEEAKRKAAAAAGNAASQVGPGPGSTGGAPSGGGMDDLNKRLIAAGPKPFFKGT